MTQEAFAAALAAAGVEPVSVLQMATAVKAKDRALVLALTVMVGPQPARV